MQTFSVPPDIGAFPTHCTQLCTNSPQLSVVNSLKGQRVKRPTQHPFTSSPWAHSLWEGVSEGEGFDEGWSRFTYTKRVWEGRVTGVRNEMGHGELRGDCFHKLRTQPRLSLNKP